MGKIKTSIVDKNGKSTHVWKNPDVPGGNKSFDRLGNVATQYVPISPEESESNFSGIVFSTYMGTITTKDGGDMVPLSVPEMGAVSTELAAFQWEGVVSEKSKTTRISKDLAVSYDGPVFTIHDSRAGNITLNGDEASLLARNIDLYMNSARRVDGLLQVSGYADFVETAVSDRERNYYITLGEGSLVEFDVSTSGLSPDESISYEDDRDRVSFSRVDGEPDKVHAQFTFADDGFAFEGRTDEMNEEELNIFRDQIQENLDEVDPRWSVSVENEDIAELIFNHYDEVEVDSENRAEFTTSNILASGEMNMAASINNAYQVVWDAVEKLWPSSR